MERTFVRKTLTEQTFGVIIYPEQKMTRLTNGVGPPQTSHYIYNDSRLTTIHKQFLHIFFV